MISAAQLKEKTTSEEQRLNTTVKTYMLHDLEKRLEIAAALGEHSYTINSYPWTDICSAPSKKLIEELTALGYECSFETKNDFIFLLIKWGE